MVGERGKKREGAADVCDPEVFERGELCNEGESVGGGARRSLTGRGGVHEHNAVERAEGDGTQGGEIGKGKIFGSLLGRNELETKPELPTQTQAGEIEGDNEQTQEKGPEALGYSAAGLCRHGHVAGKPKSVGIGLRVN